MTELQEKDFIHEEYGKDPFPFWFWAFIVLTFAGIISASVLWYNNIMERQLETNPFLRVTNRDFSLFLWQNPQFMRVHAKNKTGYLPGFQYQQKVSLEVDKADDFVLAPPDILFLYHTWHRLLGEYNYNRPIPTKEFQEFLNYAEEWRPENWTAAPKRYSVLVDSLSQSDLNDLQNLPLADFPLEVRQAFLGWKNYFKEGEQINAMKPTYVHMDNFLRYFPNFRRNLWQNVVMNTTPNYLKDFELGKYEINQEIPEDQIAPFLKVAYYNYIKSLPQNSSVRGNVPFLEFKAR